jgi:hypothetical protein
VCGGEGGKCNYDKGRSITNDDLLYTKTNKRNKTWVMNSILVHMENTNTYQPDAHSMTIIIKK